MGFTNGLTPTEIDKHRATWELREAVANGRNYTDAEFAELLARVGVPDAAKQLQAARHFIYRNKPGGQAPLSNIDPFDPVDLNNPNDPRNKLRPWKEAGPA